MAAQGWLQRWQRLSRRQRLAASLAGGVLFLGSVDALLLRPLRQRLHRLHQEVRTAERRLVESIVASRQADAVNQAFAAYEPYVRPAGSPEQELAGVLSEVESAIRQSGLVPLSLKPAPAQEGAPGTISVAVEGESTPEQLVQLLDGIQRSTRLLRVTDLTVRVVDGKVLRSSLVVSKRSLTP
jgi:hypothetical protein